MFVTIIFTVNEAGTVHTVTVAMAVTMAVTLWLPLLMMMMLL